MKSANFILNPITVSNFVVTEAAWPTNALIAN